MSRAIGSRTDGLPAFLRDLRLLYESAGQPYGPGEENRRRWALDVLRGEVRHRERRRAGRMGRDPRRVRPL